MKKQLDPKPHVNSCYEDRDHVVQYDTGIKIETVEPKELYNYFSCESFHVCLYYFLVIMSHISARQSTLMFSSSFHNKNKCDIAASFFKSQPATKTLH